MKRAKRRRRRPDGGKAIDALDRKLIEVDCIEHIIRRQQAPVEVEMDPNLEDRERRRFGGTDDGAAGPIPAPARNARPLARQVGERPPADPPAESQAARP